jgi:hypothetical protein
MQLDIGYLRERETDGAELLDAFLSSHFGRVHQAHLIPFQVCSLLTKLQHETLDNVFLILSTISTMTEKVIDAHADMESTQPLSLLFRGRPLNPPAKPQLTTSRQRLCCYSFPFQFNSVPQRRKRTVPELTNAGLPRPESGNASARPGSRHRTICTVVERGGRQQLSHADAVVLIQPELRPA